MAQFHSYANEAREILRNSRRHIDLLVRAGQVRSSDAEQAFRDMASAQLRKLGRSVPKAWNTTAPKTRPRLVKKAIAVKSSPAASIGAAVAIGVAINGAVHIAKNIRRYRRGETTAREGVKDAASHVAVSAVTTTGLVLAAEGIKVAARTAPQMIQRFAKGSAPITIISGVAEMSVDAYYGRLTKVSAATTVVRTGAAWAGAEAGAVAGAWAGTFFAPVTLGLSVPVGAALGAIAGGFAASTGVTAIKDRYSGSAPPPITATS